MIYLPQEGKLNIGSFSRILDKKSESYKLFWFRGILYYVKKNRKHMTYRDIIFRMIIDAWYMVSEYHLNLGPSDTLEKLVLYMADITGFTPLEKEENIIAFLKKTKDRTVKTQLKTLTLNVPYRLQAPFLVVNDKRMWYKRDTITSLINNTEGLIYNINYSGGLESSIEIKNEWFEYLQQNIEIIEGWVNYNLIQYLQKRNPTVPGIPDKLNPPRTRVLTSVTRYWKELVSLEEFRDIYSGEILESKSISIDHFIPWSYVASDEIYNLIPTPKSVNSSKSNCLPDWNKYFSLLSKQEYRAYMIAENNESIQKKLNTCLKNNLNSDRIRHSLYRNGLSETEFTNILEETLLPVYESAKNCGFKEWIYK